MSRHSQKKLEISHVLPYGFSGRNSFRLCVESSTYAFLSYSPTVTMDERISECKAAVSRSTAVIERIERLNYITTKQRSITSSNSAVYMVDQLTKHGLYLLVGVFSRKLETQRQEELIGKRKDKDSSKIATTYLPRKPERRLMIELYELAKEAEQSNTAAQAYNDLYLESVDTLMLTPISYGMAQIERVNCLIDSRIGATRIYRYARLMNAINLFRSNNFLTCLDRRHIHTVEEAEIKKDIIQSEAENPVQGENVRESEAPADGTMDVAKYVRFSLQRWYDTFPDSYLFEEPLRSLNDEVNRKEWESTPEFYAIHELPGVLNALDRITNSGAAGRRNVLHHTMIGVGIGNIENYAVYHARPSKFFWSVPIERQSANAVQNAIDRYCEANGEIMGAKRRIINAIMLCNSVFQFSLLFSKRSAQNWEGAPYLNFCLVPVNGSGAMQLRLLLQTTPQNCENQIIRELMHANPEFHKTNDPIFRLAYHDKPVLVAHTMNYRQLRGALSVYQDGTRFYTACYPEQVAYLRRLFPETEYL